MSLFSGVGDGTFNTQTTMVVGDRPTWVAAADFTGDKRPDLAVVNSNSGSVTIINTPKPATHLLMDAAPTATAGTSFQVTVTALDEDGHVVPDFTGTVNLSSDDLLADMPDPFTFTVDDHGVHTFDVTLKTAGTHDVTLTGDLGPLTASVEVAPAAADHIQFDTPTTGIAGQPFDVTVWMFDPYGNLDTGFRGTVQFATTDPNSGASHPIDYAFTDTDAGSHTFVGEFTMLTAGSQTVSVTATDLPTVAGSLDVSPAVASRLAISAATTIQAGTAIDVTVTAFDPYDNHATAFTGTVHFDSTDPIADVPVDYTFTGLDQGTRTVQVTLKRSGLQTVTVSSTGLTGDQTAGIQVNPGDAVKLAFVNPVANTFPSLAVPAPVTLQFKDQFDNLGCGRVAREPDIRVQHDQGQIEGCVVGISGREWSW